MTSLIKDYRVLIWILFIVVSIVLIGPKFDRSGVEVISTSLEDLSPGDVIFTIDDKLVTQEVLDFNYTKLVKIKTERGTIFIPGNGSLDIEYGPVPFSALKFGLDLKGGTRAIVEPVAVEGVTVQEIILTLQNRIDMFGLRNAVFRPISLGNQTFVEILIAGGNKQELEELLEKQGKFEANIVVFTKDTLKADKDYAVDISNGTVSVEGIGVVTEGQVFELGGLPFTYGGLNDEANFTAQVFTSEDIKMVLVGPQDSFIRQLDDGFSWSFGIQLSNFGAQKFFWAVQNLESVFDPNIGKSYLSSNIDLYLDDSMIDSLSIAPELKDSPISTPSVTGSAATQEEAAKSRHFLQTILRSGSLPTEIKIVELNTVSPRLGSNFLINMVYAAIAALLALAVVVIIRYRKIKIVIPMIVVSISELIITVGVLSLIGATIDLAAIAGLIAAIGTGVDDQLVIVDNLFRKRDDESTLKERIKRAFFIIFGAAGTVVAAMMPLLIIGFGVLQNFAITTILGILIGIFITRPVFAKLMERIVGQ